MTTATATEKPSAWGTLRHPVFRNCWASAVVSNVGSWMQDTAGTWLMTSLTTSPLLIALMQTAAGLPVLLLGYPAGATADIVDRRRLLIFWQVWMLATVAVLSVLTFAGIISPWTLLALTFLLNIGAAMNNPAWQAIVPELVPKEGERHRGKQRRLQPGARGGASDWRADGGGLRYSDVGRGRGIPGELTFLRSRDCCALLLAKHAGL